MKCEVLTYPYIRCSRRKVLKWQLPCNVIDTWRQGSGSNTKWKTWKQKNKTLHLNLSLSFAWKLFERGLVSCNAIYCQTLKIPRLKLHYKIVLLSRNMLLCFAMCFSCNFVVQIMKFVSNMYNVNDSIINNTVKAYLHGIFRTACS